MLGTEAHAACLKSIHHIARALSDGRLAPAFHGTQDLGLAQTQLAHPFGGVVSPGHRSNAQLHDGFPVALALLQVLERQIDVAVDLGCEAEHTGKKLLEPGSLEAVALDHHAQGEWHRARAPVFLCVGAVQRREQVIEEFRFTRGGADEKRGINPRAHPNGCRVRDLRVVDGANVSRCGHHLLCDPGVEELRVILGAFVCFPAEWNAVARESGTPPRPSQIGVNACAHCAQCVRNVKNLCEAVELGRAQVGDNLGDKGVVTVTQERDWAQQVLCIAGSGPVAGTAKLVDLFLKNLAFNGVEQRWARPEHQIAFFVVNIVAVAIHRFINQVMHCQRKTLGSGVLLIGVLDQGLGAIQIAAKDGLELVAAMIQKDRKRSEEAESWK